MSKKFVYCNPFVIGSGPVKVISVGNDIDMDAVSRDGEVKGKTKVYAPYQVVVDKGPSTYDVDGHAILFKNLGKNSLAMMYYIHVHNKKGRGYVDLPPNDVCEEMSMTLSTFYRLIKELLHAGIIAKREGSTWWVNPRYSFFGDKVKYFRAHGDVGVSKIRNIKNVDVQADATEEKKEG